MESIPLPELLTCRLSIKNGEPFGASRDKVPPSPAFLYKLSEGYSILRKKIEEHFESKLPGQWKPTFDIYLKPSNNAKQKQFEIVCQETVALLAQVKEVWNRARRRRNGQARFELELFIYFPKQETPTPLRRACAARIQEQPPRVAAFLREQQVEAGPASERYMAVTLARLPEGTPLEVPDSVTFRQLQHIDVQQATIDGAMTVQLQQSAGEYQVVRIKIHGVPVPVQVNIGDLREALELPNYSLRPHSDNRQIRTHRNQPLISKTKNT
ncbi:hypothetical protein PC129_g17932 [Phytophthora cactorum]|uniref:Uncharacterized protein n=1 Tax=Phytophthora cactorum TaxID=29920 RepID=A0A8T1F738_9STRA|nr:hypothetical protein Pcac1_g17791 [Phytophthora cactorum]KAG2804017.1 hypothetical protein PC111_g18442 [Phytophthora cactorum]KAG2804507.1 hypothetical protein PC112_g18693 [Phytophthora cactorum]KAG2840237.1 hypothetical protein PC113_g19308 [Phytophthora cactorum]KAG2893978.1 hypothetical protein PC114_g16067 [Phytophthora cactorum]